MTNKNFTQEKTHPLKDEPQRRGNRPDEVEPDKYTPKRNSQKEKM